MFSPLLLAILLLPGCPPPCEGAGCGDLYPAADLQLLRGSGLVDGVRSPLEADGTVAGAAEDGTERALKMGDGALLVGVPDDGEVRDLDLAAFLEGAAPRGTLRGEGTDDGFGAALGTLPGYLLVGAPRRAAGATAQEAGAVWVFPDVDAGVSGDLDTTAALAVVTGLRGEDRLGSVVAGCGDLDGDGAMDWAAGAPWAEDGGSLAGTVYAWTSRGGPLSGEVDAGTLAALPGTTMGGRWGAALSCSTSLDGDALADLVVGAPYDDGDLLEASGVVAIFRGATDFGADAATLRLAGPEDGAWFGSALLVADLGGDGLPELVVGAPGRSASAEEDDSAGAVYVYDGADLQAALNAPAFAIGALDPVRELRGVYGRARFGATLLAADLDGDGVLDLVVGAPGYNPTGEEAAVQAGAAYVFAGPWDAWPVPDYATHADVTIVDDRQYLRTGETMAVGDLDGDGVADLVLANRASGS